MKKNNKSSNPSPLYREMSGVDSEFWKVIPDFPRYEVSNKGRVRSNCCYHGRKVRFIMKPSLRCDGYLYVKLFYLDPQTKRVKRKHKFIHRLVARAFIGECKNGRVVDHISGDKWDNSVENLRYATPSENRRSTHIERFKEGFKIEVFRDGVFIEEVTSRKRLLEVVGSKTHLKNGGFCLNSLFCNGRTWRYKNFFAVLVLPHDEVEPGPAPHVQFKLEV